MCYEIHSSASGTMKIIYSRLKRTAANSSAKVALQFFIEHFSLLSTAEMGGGGKAVGQFISGYLQAVWFG